MMICDAKPNILVVISDDQSWYHTGFFDKPWIKTPAFDALFESGIYFENGFCPSPQCSPSRAALLSGKNLWELDEASTLYSAFPADLQVYPDMLEKVGYHVGYTGKPWAPGDWQRSGRSRNPAGNEYNIYEHEVPTQKISKKDYARNFEAFLADRPEGAPFCFWFGCHEPHREYEEGSGLRLGKQLEEAVVPEFLPDVETVQSDLLDYAVEIEWFDKQLQRFLNILKDRGELENTFLVVTSDNGMPFPHAKANLYEYGIHVPLVISFPNVFSGGRRVSDFVSLIDVMPTILEAADVAVPDDVSGKSLYGELRRDCHGQLNPERECVLIAKERHNHARPDNVGYPCRGIRQGDYLYVHNFEPDRWPIGDPPFYLCHTKMYNPSKNYILAHKDDPNVKPFYDMTYAKRDREELYCIPDDMGCVRNLASDPKYQHVKTELKEKMFSLLKDQNDPRLHGKGDLFDSYPYFGPMNEHLPGFKERGKYNPKFQNHSNAHLL